MQNIGQKGRCHLQDQSVDGKIILKYTVRNSTGGCQWQDVVNVIHNNTLGCMKYLEFCD